jgi:CYTH domain-containing protein
MIIEPEKYARVERERRFLVRQVPTLDVWAERRIVDFYIASTRLRLRRSEGVVNGVKERVFKLTQKRPAVGAPNGVQGHITTIYLSEKEYLQFSKLPSLVISKTRLRFPPMGVDVFDGQLSGLIIAEAEFENDHDMQSFTPPGYCEKEITGLVEYTGFNLAIIAALLPTEAKSRLFDLIKA